MAKEHETKERAMETTGGARYSDKTLQLAKEMLESDWHTWTDIEFKRGKWLTKYCANCGGLKLCKKTVEQTGFYEHLQPAVSESYKNDKTPSEAMLEAIENHQRIAILAIHAKEWVHSLPMKMLREYDEIQYDEYDKFLAWAYKKGYIDSPSREEHETTKGE